ncbi:MAG: Amuc_1100 family pilus-like protein [Verrucomicrobiota bacterium]
MSWVKRNLYFLIGSIVAVLLLGVAGYYFWTNYELNEANLEELNKGYSELSQLTTSKPKSDTVDNIERATEQAKLVRAAIDKEHKFFQPILPVPNPTNGIVTKDEFASGLRRSIDELTRSAATASVLLPPKYGFSFDAERGLTVFAEGSLPALAQQLGEIKALCNVLFQAKINSLDALRRARVSADDAKGPVSDFTDGVSTTNALAVITPYEIVFHSFTPELAAVLSGFANDPHCMIVRALNIEPGAMDSSPATSPDLSAGSGFGAAPIPGGPPGGFAPAAPAAPAASKGGMTTVLDEKQLKVTMVIDIVKLIQKP